MRYAGLILWLVFACNASAQVNPAGDAPLASSTPTLAMAVPPPGPAPFLAAGEPVPVPTPAPDSNGRQPVYGVLEDLDFQVYGGFTYFRFYELPGITGNLDGFNVSLVYYPHAGHLGVDGEFAVGFAPQTSASTTLDAGMGGGRFRVTVPHGVEVWAHALAGGAHFVPKTPYGSETALAFEGGGGVDFTLPHQRFGFRVEGDLLGTYLFSTHQYSPKISVGVVYKF
jgi:hypothetical protein